MPPKLRNQDSESLTIASIRTLWEKEFLPSIREEIKAEIDGMKREITSLTVKCNDIENSQTFLSSEYDSLKGSLQETKKDISEVSKTLKSLNDKVGSSDRDLHETRETLDDLQQYLLRDCIEITGIPTPPKDDPKQIAVQVGQMLGIPVSEHHISTAHRLPSTRKIKDRIIVKFVHRDMREAFYKNRSKLIGKKSKDVPLIASEYGKSIHETNNIYINESLTFHRKRLFGKVNEFKRRSKWKYVWTVNGKIYLRESENTRAYDFNSIDQFESFLGQFE